MKELERLEKNNTTNCLWPYILRVLADNPVHAYQLREQVKERFGFRCGRVSAYHVIYKLTKGGMVSKKQEGRKVVYSITPKGRELLKKAAGFYSSRARMLS